MNLKYLLLTSALLSTLPSAFSAFGMVGNIHFIKGDKPTTPGLLGRGWGLIRKPQLFRECKEAKNVNECLETPNCAFCNSPVEASAGEAYNCFNFMEKRCPLGIVAYRKINGEYRMTWGTASTEAEDSFNLTKQALSIDDIENRLKDMITKDQHNFQQQLKADSFDLENNIDLENNFLLENIDHAAIANRVIVDFFKKVIPNDVDTKLDDAILKFELNNIAIEPDMTLEEYAETKMREAEGYRRLFQGPFDQAMTELLRERVSFPHHSD